MPAPAKKILFILRNTPYGSSRAQEGLDAIFAASVFDQQVTALFMDEGIWQLHRYQQSHGVQHNIPHIDEHKNIAAQLESFPLYDINSVYVDHAALKRFNIPKQELILEPELVNDKAIRALIATHDVVLTY
jgi:tRNA 2-thiouridine synthesizing protein C